jgi:hypothetical protein
LLGVAGFGLRARRNVGGKFFRRRGGTAGDCKKQSKQQWRGRADSNQFSAPASDPTWYIKLTQHIEADVARLTFHLPTGGQIPDGATTPVRGAVAMSWIASAALSSLQLISAPETFRPILRQSPTSIRSGNPSIERPADRARIRRHGAAPP